MNRNEAIFILNQFETECRKNHLDSEAEAHAMGIYALGTIEELRKERDAAMAQPEVIRCKDCKHRHLENDVWTCPFGLPGGPDFYCGYGAKMEVEHE